MFSITRGGVRLCMRGPHLICVEKLGIPRIKSHFSCVFLMGSLQCIVDCVQIENTWGYHFAFHRYIPTILLPSFLFLEDLRSTDLLPYSIFFRMIWTRFEPIGSKLDLIHLIPLVYKRRVP